MKPRLSSLLLVALSLCSLFAPVVARELVFVQALWRHGDRAPLSLPYPKDPYNESAWQRGWQQLTNVSFDSNEARSRAATEVFRSVWCN